MKDLLTRLIEKAELSETQIEILKLDQRGYSSKRIALELGIAVDSVYARRSEAMRKLKLAAALSGDSTTDAPPPDVKKKKKPKGE